TFSFGCWQRVWIATYGPVGGGGKPIASWVPFTILGFEVMVLVGGLATVFAMFGFAGIPRLTMTVGYDRRFSGGHFGVWVAAEGNDAATAESILKKHGAEEVRR